MSAQLQFLHRLGLWKFLDIECSCKHETIIWLILVRFDKLFCNNSLDQIEARKKTRQRRAKEEKRREKRIEAEENRKYGKQSHYNLHLESNDQFPEFGLENRVRTESQEPGVSDLSSSSETGGNDSSSLEAASSSFTGPSFATVSVLILKQSLFLLTY